VVWSGTSGRAPGQSQEWVSPLLRCPDGFMMNDTGTQSLLPRPTVLPITSHSSTSVIHGLPVMIDGRATRTEYNGISYTADGPARTSTQHPTPPPFLRQDSGGLLQGRHRLHGAVAPRSNTPDWPPSFRGPLVFPRADGSGACRLCGRCSVRRRRTAL
jgi:hypothetical protein